MHSVYNTQHKQKVAVIHQVCANFSKIPHDAHLHILMRNSAL